MHTSAKFKGRAKLKSSTRSSVLVSLTGGHADFLTGGYAKFVPGNF